PSPVPQRWRAEDRATRQARPEMTPYVPTLTLSLLLRRTWANPDRALSGDHRPNAVFGRSEAHPGAIRHPPESAALPADPRRLPARCQLVGLRNRSDGCLAGVHLAQCSHRRNPGRGVAAVPNDLFENRDQVVIGERARHQPSLFTRRAG